MGPFEGLRKWWREAKKGETITVTFGDQATEHKGDTRPTPDGRTPVAGSIFARLADAHPPAALEHERPENLEQAPSDMRGSPRYTSPFGRKRK